MAQKLNISPRQLVAGLGIAALAIGVAIAIAVSGKKKKKLQNTKSTTENKTQSLMV
jgi:hypothetical protein